MTPSIDTYRTITPYLVVPDADAEMTFLKTAFGGAEVTCQRNADNSVMHAEIKIGDSLIMLGQSGAQWKALNAALYLWVEDVEASPGGLALPSGSHMHALFGRCDVSHHGRIGIGHLRP